MAQRNLLYAQSGGMTAVINATAAAVIARAREYSEIGRVFAAHDGILGVIAEDLLDTAGLGEHELESLALTPGGAFGSCRFDLPALEDAAFYDRLFAVLAAHEVGYFLYNGGNGSMDAVLKIDAAAKTRGYPLVCVGVPKTVDNDLVATDCSPGFGSAARYLATSMWEAGLDVASMYSRKGRVFVFEVMGRNAGWLAAATALAAREAEAPPHLILFPERSFEREPFLHAVREWVERIGFCAITVAEGVRDPEGRPLAEQTLDKASPYVQLGGAGGWIAQLISRELGYKHHYAVPDYLQRSAGHCVAGVDRAQAEAVGRAAVDLAVAGRACVMPAIRRLGDAPYRWDVEAAGLEQVANLEKRLPDEFIREDGMGVTEACLRYLRPLIGGAEPGVGEDGLPLYRRLEFAAVERRLPPSPAR